MPQNGQRRRRQAGERQLYDQARDTRRPSRSGRSGRRGVQRSGYQERTISFEAPSSAPRRADNGIEFPASARGNGAQAQRARGQRRQPQGQRPAQGRLRPTEANTRDPARREKRKKRRLTHAEMRRRRLARRVTAFILLLCVISAGVYLTVTMLFKVSSVCVQTQEGIVVEQLGGYSSEQILQVLGVQAGDNIFSFDPAAKEAVLERQFPLLEEIDVICRYPSSVYVRAVEAAPAWAMQTQSGWLTISGRLKILSVGSEQPALPTLYGGEPLSASPGEQLAFAPVPQAGSEASSEAAAAETEDTRLEELSTLLAALSERGMLADVTRIEFENTEQAAFLYQNRISVLLGTLNELDYKLDFAQYLLLNTDGKGCSPTDTGELDCSHVRTDGTLRPILSQGEPVLPSGYTVSGGMPQAEQPADETQEQPAEEQAAEQLVE